MHRRPRRRSFAWLALALAACGGGGDGEDRRSPDTPPAAGPAEPQDASTAEPRQPSAPKRNFSAQRAPRGPRHDQLAAAVDPAHGADPWPSEQLAMGAESLVEFLVKGLIEGGDTDRLQGVITRQVAGRVDGEELAGEALLERLSALVALPRVGPSGPALRVHAVRSEAPRPLEGAKAAEAITRVLVLAGSEPQDLGPSESTQVQLDLEITWRIAKRLRAHRIVVNAHDRRSRAALYRDVTAAVLDGGAMGESDRDAVLALGALEAAGRTDRLESVNEILLGMHGIAAGDLDGDGDEDLVVGRTGGQPDLLLINDRGRFTEQGRARGFCGLESTGGFLILDLDGDGARDIVFGRGVDVCVAWNDGAGRFAPAVALDPAGTEGRARVYSLCAADVDGDGDLDLYDTRYFRSGGYGAQAPTPYDDATNGARNVFWRNLLADGTARAFRDDTDAIGLDVDNDRFSLSAVFDDLDGDGDLDLYVTNDFGRNTLYLWEGTGFRQAAEDTGLTDKAAGMGISVSDVDLDGRRDLVISNMHSPAGMRVTRSERFQARRSPEDRLDFMRHARGNTLYRGVEGGRFEDVSERAGASPGGWAWGARFVDGDRDGLPEIVVPNGFLSGRVGPDLASFFWRRVVGASPVTDDTAELQQYLDAWGTISNLSQFGRQHWNAHERTFSYGNGGGFAFTDDTLLTGLGYPDDGRALIEVDLDQDGRLDLVQRNRTSPILRVFQGIGPAGSWASFRLAGKAPNADAIGAELRVTAGEIIRRRRVIAGDGFLGGSTLELHLGFAQDAPPRSVQVRWPDGTEEDFTAEGGWLGGAWRLERGAGQAVLRHRGGASVPALDESVPRPLAGGVPGPERSFVGLHEEIPLGAWRLVEFGDAPRPATDRTGAAGLAVVVWRTGDERSEAALATLGARRAALEAQGLELFALSLDGVRDAKAAATRSAELAPGLAAGRADRPTRAVLEMMVARTLSPYEDLPLPLVLGLDGAGDLVWLSVGEADPGTIERAALRVAARGDVDSTEELLGGSFTGAPPRRGFGPMADWLQERGFDGLAAGLRAREDALNAEPSGR